MDSSSLRYLLIALAGALAVCVNIPWRRTAWSLRRSVHSIVTPRDLTAWNTRARPRQFAVAPAKVRGSSRLYAQTRARARN